MPRTRYCSVFNCPNDSRTMSHLTYFGVPKNEESRINWMSAIGREDLLAKKSNAFVCSIHFTKAMFVNRRLKKDALPSLNLSDSKTARTMSWINKLPINSVLSDPSSSEDCSNKTSECTEQQLEQLETLNQSSKPTINASTGTQTMLLYLEWPQISTQTDAKVEKIASNNNEEKSKIDDTPNNLKHTLSTDEPIKVIVLFKSEPDSPPEIRFEYISKENILMYL